MILFSFSFFLPFLFSCLCCSKEKHEYVSNTTVCAQACRQAASLSLNGKGCPTTPWGLLALTVLGGSADAPPVLVSGNGRDLTHSLNLVCPDRKNAVTHIAGNVQLLLKCKRQTTCKDLFLLSRLGHLTRTTPTKTCLKLCIYHTGCISWAVTEDN